MGTPGAFFQRKLRAMDTQTDTNIHMPSYRHTGTKCKHNHTVTPWQPYSEPHIFWNKAKTRAETGKQNTLRNTRDKTGTRGTRRNTPQHGLNLLRYTPHLGAHSGAPGDTPTGGGGGDKEAPAHLAPPARPRVPAGAPSVRARACVPADARRHLWEERCALRPGRPGCAALGERLPWRAELGRILIERPRALPHCCPLPLPTLSSSFSEVTPSRAPHSEGLSPWPEPLA